MRDPRLLHMREWFLRTRQFKTSNLSVVGGGRHSVSPLYHVTYNPCHVAVLVYVLAGEGYVRYAGKEFRAGSDSIFVLINGMNVSYRTNPKNLWKFLWVGFKGENIPALLSRAGLTPSHPVLTGPHIHELRSHFVELQQLGADGGSGVFCSVLGKLWMLLGELIDRQSSTRQRRTPDSPQSFDLTTRVSKYLVEHLAEPITLEQLSRQFHVSPYHLVHVFRKEMGQSPIDHLIDERIRLAQRLLFDENESIAAVAKRVSYEDAAYFSRLFKQRTGFSPMQHRKRHTGRRA
jgi:AraC-like DNA-binding protein